MNVTDTSFVKASFLCWGSGCYLPSSALAAKASSNFANNKLRLAFQGAQLLLKLTVSAHPCVVGPNVIKQFALWAAFSLCTCLDGGLTELCCALWFLLLLFSISRMKSMACWKSKIYCDYKIFLYINKNQYTVCFFFIELKVFVNLTYLYLKSKVSFSP